MIKDIVICKKIDNSNISSLTIDRWKSIVDMVSKYQVDSASILLLQVLP